MKRIARWLTVAAFVGSMVWGGLAPWGGERGGDGGGLAPDGRHAPVYGVAR